MTTAYVRTTGEILKEFNVAPDTGPSSAEVIHRREQSGPNSLAYAMRKIAWSIPVAQTKYYRLSARCWLPGAA